MSFPLHLVKGLAVVVVVHTTLQIVLAYHSYFPADFNSDFLFGRQSYFAGAYSFAFYPHILSGPVTLLLGPLLLSDRFRLRFRRWHRLLGRVQVALVLLVLTPSGLWMAAYAQGGPAASLGLALLALLTATAAAMGCRQAIRQRFASHRWWMIRCYALLCSTVLLRKIGGLAELLELEGTYPLATWISWLAPLAAVEACRLIHQPARRPQW